VRNNDGSIVEGDVEESYFDSFDLVASGHYHDWSEIGENIVYFRSAYQANFGEDDNKGFTVVYDDCSLEYIQSKFPIYRKIIIDMNDTESMIEVAALPKVDVTESLISEV